MTPPEVRATFPAEPASASAARRFLDRNLRDWSCEHLTDVATLLVSELVANAVLHAGTTIEVAARVVDGRLRIEVRDGNARMPARKHYSRMSATGRGLLLVERMADDWGVDATATGKVVWFELDDSPSQRASGSAAMAAFADVEFDLDDLEPADRGPRRDERHPRGRGPGDGPRLLAGAGLTLRR